MHQPEPVQARLYPGLLDGDSNVRVIRVLPVRDLLDGGHEHGQADVARVRRDYPLLPIHRRLLDEWDHLLEARQVLLAPRGQLVGLGQESPGVEDIAPGADDGPVHRVFGEDVRREGVRIALEYRLGHLLPREGV